MVKAVTTFENDGAAQGELLTAVAAGYNSDGVELSLIVAFLRLTETERLQMAERHAVAVHTLQAAFACVSTTPDAFSSIASDALDSSESCSALSTIAPVAARPLLV